MKLHQHLVYALEPEDLGEVKIGISTLKNFASRVAACQTYHSRRVKCLGIILCDSRGESVATESYLLDRFGRLHPDREWIMDGKIVRDYIKEHFVSGKKALKLSQKYRKRKYRGKY